MDNQAEELDDVCVSCERKHDPEKEKRWQCVQEGPMCPRCWDDMEREEYYSGFDDLDSHWDRAPGYDD